jgi:hypothetical protein
MSPIDIRTARNRFLRALVAALAVAAGVAGSAFALTKHPGGGQAEPWVADSAKLRAKLDQALGGMEQQPIARTWTYKPIKIKKWVRPKPRIVVTAPRVVTVNNNGGSSGSHSTTQTTHKPTTSASSTGSDDSTDTSDNGGTTSGDN